MKAEAFDWLDRNHPAFNSLDSMAEAMTRQQPIKFRTARDWVADWRKLRSAGKP